MIRTLRRVSLRHLAAQKARTSLTVFGIALGVATMVSVRILAEAMPEAYERMIDGLAGRAELQVTNGDLGVPEPLLDEVRAVPGVAAATAAVFGTVWRSERPEDVLAVLGIDLIGDNAVRVLDAVDVAERAGDPLAFVAEPASIGVTTRFLEETGLRVGDAVTVYAPAGQTTLTIRTALDVRAGPAKLFGGRFAVMDLYAAQQLFRLGGRFSQIDVVPAEGVKIEELRARLEKVVGSRGAVERPETRGEMLDRLLASTRYVTTLGAASAVIVGLYLIFNTMMVAVVQRRRELGILRSLGMSRGAVITMVVAEAILLALAGAALGVTLGLGLVRLLEPAAVGDVLRNYFVAFDVPDVSLRLSPLLWGMAFAVASAVVAAIIPAREAVRVQPIENLRPPVLENDAAPFYGRLAAAGASLFAVAVVLRFARDAVPLDTQRLGRIVLAAEGFGLVLLVPAAIRSLVLRAETPLGRLLGLTGTIAGRNLVRHMGRVAVTASAFFASLAFAVFAATCFGSVRHTAWRSIAGYFDSTDLAIYVLPAPRELAREIASLPEVESVGVVRSLKVAYEGSQVFLAGRGVEPPNPELHRQRLERFLTVLDSEPGEVIRRFTLGEGVLVNEAFRARFGRGPGDRIALPSPTGPVELPILATYSDATGASLGVVLVEINVFRRLWRDETVNVLEPRLRPGQDSLRVAAAIRDRWGGKHPMLSLTLDQFRGDVEASITRGFSTAVSSVTIAVAIALLGIANSLFACILDRVREIGVLRAVGATRGQIALSVILESAMIGAVAALLAVAAGSAMGAYDLEIFYQWIFSQRVFYRFPTAAIVVGLVGGIVSAAAAGGLPALRAARLKPAEAIQYE